MIGQIQHSCARLILLLTFGIK